MAATPTGILVVPPPALPQGNNPGKASVGYAAVAAKALPSCNEASVRLLLGSAYREAAARGLRAEPVFGFFHRASSTTRVMMRLAQTRPPQPSQVEVGLGLGLGFGLG